MKYNIPQKNYIILAVLCMATVLLVFLLATWYRHTGFETVEESILLSVLSEISLPEMDDYLVENLDVILYIVPKHNSDNQSFEQTFNDYLIEQDLTRYVLFIDADKIEINQEYEQFLNHYKASDCPKEHCSLVKRMEPFLVFIQNGQIAYIYSEGSEQLKFDEVEPLIVEYGFVES